LAFPLQLRPFEPADWPGVWGLLEPVFRAGETFPQDPAITEAEAKLLWVDHSQAVTVAVDAAGAVVGTYYLRPNALCLGSHVANAGYVVAERCRREGVGSRLCEHSLEAARRLGFRAMQFNLVVSSNTAGLRCWQANGFRIVGTLPGAFHHRRLGDVDAHVMFRSLGGQRQSGGAQPAPAMTPTREQILAASAGWVAVLLNVLPGLGAGYLYQRRWKAYWITSALASGWFVAGALLARDAPAAAEAQNQLVGLIGLLLLAAVTAAEAGLAVKRARQAV
jgi:L-amino acid N-acyltransferase YncA